MSCSFDNAEVYAGGKAEEVMGQAIKVCQLSSLLHMHETQAAAVKL